MRPITLGVLALWFVVVFLLGAAGAIARPPGTPPFPILIAATAPVIVFLAAYCGWPAFRAYCPVPRPSPGDGDPGLARGRARVPGPVRPRGAAGGLRLAGRPGGHRHRGDRPVGRPRPCPPTRLCDQPRFRGLEPARDLGLGRRGERRGSEFRPCLGRPRGGDDRANGAVAARADPGVPGAIVRHTALGCTLPGASAGVVDGLGEPAWLVALANCVGRSGRGVRRHYAMRRRATTGITKINVLLTHQIALVSPRTRPFAPMIAAPNAARPLVKAISSAINPRVATPQHFNRR